MSAFAGKTKAVVAGEDVVIASNGVPMVRLVPVKARRKPRKPSAWLKLPVAGIGLGRTGIKPADCRRTDGHARTMTRYLLDTHV